MLVEPQSWEVPSNLPECWWIDIEKNSGQREWYGPFDSQAEAKGDYVWGQFHEWIDPPVRTVFVQDDAASFTKRHYYGIYNRACVTARWHWFQRHRSALTKSLTPKACEILLPSTRPLESDLFSNRLGGPAVLPSGMPWPKYKITATQSQQYVHFDYKSDQVIVAPKKKYEPYFNYVATLDLRDRFAFSGSFPSAISLFVATFDPANGTYSDSADDYVDDGFIVPLYAKDELAQVNAPGGVVELPGLAVDRYAMPDFPPDSIDLSDAWPDRRKHEPYVSLKAAEAEISAKEPGSEVWLHIDGLKIGGFESYIQHSVRRRMEEKFTKLEWHFIARWSDERINIGDGGQFYILAGHDRATGEWKWHCSSDCY